jgi:hypothetical protein
MPQVCSSCGESPNIASSKLVPFLGELCAKCWARAYDEAFHAANAAWLRRCVYCKQVIPIDHRGIYCSDKCRYDDHNQKRK